MPKAKMTFLPRTDVSSLRLVGQASPSRIFGLLMLRKNVISPMLLPAQSAQHPKKIKIKN